MILKIDTERAERRLLAAFRELNKENIDKAVRRGINRALNVTRTQAIRSVTERFNIKAEDVRKGTMVTQAGSGTNTPILYGYLKSSVFQFPLSYFQPRMISGGQASRITSKREKTMAKKSRFLRTHDKTKITQGVVVAVMKGKAKAIPSAYFGRGTSVAARGKYERGFQFNQDEKGRSLTTISPASAIRGVKPVLQVFAERKFLNALHEELKKRVKKIA